MFGLIAFVLFVIACILALVDKTISVDRLIAVVAAGLAFLALQTVWGWAPWTGRGPNNP
jgi:hypothetical protein